MMSNLKVLVSGAGMGGLCLAQMLRKNSIDVEVFERDPNPRHRSQGYRLHLDAGGLMALQKALPADLHALFETVSMLTEPYTTILKTDLTVARRVFTEDYRDENDFAGPAPIHRNVDRAILREILLCGLDDVCHFGKELVSYETVRGKVKVQFSDGSAAQGDVLVGADGVHSPVRKQRAPEARLLSTGTQAIYGRINLKSATDTMPTAVLKDIFAIASDERKVFLGMGAVIFPEAPDEASFKTKKFKLSKQEDYVVCIVGGRNEFVSQDRPLREMNCHTLRQTALASLRDWPDEAAQVISWAEESSFFAIDMYTSVPGKLDVPSNVTLLGDAIHAMSPALGRGANLAMRDGARLGKQLVLAQKHDRPIAKALATFEEEMLLYSSAVVRESARIGQQRMGQNPLPEE